MVRKFWVGDKLASDRRLRGEWKKTKWYDLYALWTRCFYRRRVYWGRMNDFEWEYGAFGPKGVL